MKRVSPLVSVFVITYNQEEFIAQTMDGIISQKTNFPLEIIVGDDYSTDRTIDILKEYQKKYKNIVILESSNNHGITYNALRTLKHCSGKYIAACEGDDYWTDPLKLEKQVQILEKNNSFSVTFHSCLVKREESLFLPPNLIEKWSEDKELSLIDVLNQNTGYTLSMVFRRKLLKHLDFEFVKSLKLYDWILRFICLNFGNGYFFSEVMGVYRLHDKNQSKILINTLSYYKLRKKFLTRFINSNSCNTLIIKEYLCRLDFYMFKFHLMKGKILPSFRYFFKFLFKCKNIKTSNSNWDKNLQINFKSYLAIINKKIAGKFSFN